MPKLNTYFTYLIKELPWLNAYRLHIESANSFPHSSGIASSASSMAALASCIVEIGIKEKHIKPANKQKLISELSRLGSGSACRSAYNGWALWGKTEIIPNASDLFAVDINVVVHPEFKSIRDAIVIVNRQSKKVSSSAGHQLMDKHPYKENRIQQANRHTAKLLYALKTGDWETFGQIAENEALSLHALMLSSNPGFLLLEPESFQIIDAVRQFRENTSVPLYFTIDAGPNIHLLYPDGYHEKVLEFIESQLNTFNVIYDQIGR